MTFQLPLQNKNAQLPNQLDFLSVIARRGSSYFAKEKALYKSLHAGHLGEERVIEYIKKYGSSHWRISKNPWFNHLGNFECDLILFTDTFIKILEIKHYSGTFRYDAGKCFFGNKETSLNPIEQVRGNLADTKQMLHKVKPYPNITAAVLFTGDDNDVQIQSVPDEIEIINRTQLRNFITNLVHAENTQPGPPLNLEQIYRELAKYETTSPFMPNPLTPVEMNEIQGGILCGNCHSKQVNIEKFKVSCKCGFVEVREAAILRTICDYGVLNYRQPLRHRDIFKFLDGDASRNLLKRIMHQHFPSVKNGPASHCENPNLLFQDLKNSFNLD